MSYPHRPALRAGAAAASTLKQPAWTVRRAPPALPAANVAMRRYEVMSLTASGEMVDDVRAAPATPQFESVFTALARGTILNTEEGPVAVEDLVPGLRVETRDNGYQTLMWRGATNLAPQRHDAGGEMAMHRIPMDSFGPQRPMPDLLLGPGARLVHRNPALLNLIGTDTALLPVQAFADGVTVVPLTPVSPVRVFHLGFARHQIIAANGLEIESMHPGPEVLGCLSRDDLRRFLSLFPHLEMIGSFGPLAMPRVSAEESEAVSAA